MDTQQADSGPSSQVPVFKKRSRPVRDPQLRASLSTGEARKSTDVVGQDEQTQTKVSPGSDDDEEDGAETGPSVADLIALRNLQRRPTGIELDKLNKGLKKRKKRKAKEGGPLTDEDRWREQMERGGLVRPGQLHSQGSNAGKAGDDDDDDDDDHEDGEAAAGQGTESRSRNRLARKDNFQGETNVIDVDKHMMAYIEEEMKKRRAAAAGADGTTGAVNGPGGDLQAVLSNPEDELYKVAEKYTRLQQEARSAAQANKLITSKARPDDEQGEGNVGLSSAMLSGIPEVELGMDSRLKNIEDTEKAKRALHEARRQAKAVEADDMLANARFSRPGQQAQSDAQALAAARAAAASGQTDTDQRDRPPQAQGHKRQHHERREMASDDIVMQRFKKRQMNQMKR